MAKEEKEPPSSSTARRLARPTTIHKVPDKLLRLILGCLASPVCLGSPAWIVRAAATCKRWRWIVAGHEFHRSLLRSGTRKNRPRYPVAGVYRNSASPPAGPVFIPSSPEIDGRRLFSLDFLPHGGARAWEVVDSNASLLLLAKKKTGWMRRCFPDLAVCEPATRRYRLIPRMEEMRRHRCVGVFLSGGFESPQRSRACLSVSACTRKSPSAATFSVVCVVYEEHTLVADDVGTVRACVFDRYKCGYGRMDLQTNPGWYVDERLPSLQLRGADSLRFLCRTSTSLLIWTIKGGDNGGHGSLLVLSPSRCFSTFRLATGLVEESMTSSAVRIVDGHNYQTGRLVCLQGSDLKVFDMPWPPSGDDNAELVLRKSVQLAEATRVLAGHREEYFGGGGGLEIVAADSWSVVLAPSASRTSWVFSVDLGTMEAEERKTQKGYYDASTMAYPCELPWPPDFHACKVRCKTHMKDTKCRVICQCFN